MHYNNDGSCDHKAPGAAVRGQTLMMQPHRPRSGGIFPAEGNNYGYRKLSRFEHKME